MRCSSTRRLESAQLDAHLVIASDRNLQMLHRARMTGECTAGPDIETNLVPQSLLDQLLLVANAAEIRRIPVNDLLRRFILRKRLGERRFSSREILLHMGRRQRQHGTNPLEAVPVWVFGQRAG